ncbi:helix-turn-helix transcriptional regulator [Nonomuraea sp. NPDC050643]|uniref:helix-turn-helix domain-containing protein n=1 Tax=Nonomuraea sp. NPDC050643 TaxID=3155660 RepID=UPI003402816F
MPTSGMGDLADLSKDAPPWPGPTIIRVLIGAQLRRFREARQISRDDAGYAIRASPSKISRLEAGRTGFKLRDVADLLTLYGVSDDAERASLLALVEQANAPSWWHEYRDVIPDWFEPYLGLEQDSSLIRAYEVQLVPGLLQTEDYARAAIGHRHRDASPDEIERRVAVRMRRRHLLTRPGAHRLWVVIDEAVLHRRVADDAVMRDQWEHLARQAELPHVTVQVLPFTSGGNVGGVGPITILRFPQQELPDVVYVEHLATAQYLTKSSEVLPYHALMDELGLAALPASATAAMVRRLIDAH